MPSIVTCGIWNAADRFINPFSGEIRDDLDTTSSSNFYTLNALNISEGTYTRTPTPASGTTVNLRAQTGEYPGSATQQGAAITLANPNTSVRADVNGTWAVSAASTEAAGHHVFQDPVGATGTPTGGTAALYVQDATDASIDWHGFGSRAFNMGGTSTGRFVSFGFGGATAPTSESLVGVPWPSAGTFRYVSFVYSSTGGVTTTLALRKNSVDTAITFSLAATAGAFVLVQNTALSVAVAAGDLINWRYIQSAGGGTFTCTLLCGFIAA